MNVSLASYRETFYSLMFRYYLFIVLFFLRNNCVWIKWGKNRCKFSDEFSSLSEKRKEKKRKLLDHNFVSISKENFSPKGRSWDTLRARNNLNLRNNPKLEEDFSIKHFGQHFCNVIPIKVEGRWDRKKREGLESRFILCNRIVPLN